MRPVIIVTGGSRGIGAATAIRAAQEGYAVCVNFRSNADAANAVVAAIVENGGEALAVGADVANATDVAEMFRRVDAELGTLSALVNNAGILEKQSSFTDLSTQRLERIMATNLFGVFHCMQEAISRMSRANGGAGGGIVNVSSVAARTGAPHEYVDYAASKGALDSMSAGVAREVAPLGIRVNTVRPGFIYTEMHASGGEPERVDRLVPGIPLKRGGQPDDVASAIMWLLSDSAQYAVGVSLDVTGGI